MAKVKKSNGQSGVIKEMRRIGAGIERRIGVKIEGVEHKIDLLSENQVGMKEKLDATFEVAGKLSEDMTIVKDGLELIKGGLKRKVDMDEFAALERRVAMLERKSR